MLWNAVNICDDGIDAILDTTQDVICDLIKDAMKDFDKKKDVEQHIIEYLQRNFNRYMENVVKEIDDDIGQLIEYNIETMYDFARAIQDKADLETEEAQSTIEKLNEKLDEAKEMRRITVNGIEYVWIPERQVFVSIIGTVLALTEIDDCSISAILA